MKLSTIFYVGVAFVIVVAIISKKAKVVIAEEREKLTPDYSGAEKILFN